MQKSMAFPQTSSKQLENIAACSEYHSQNHKNYNIPKKNQPKEKCAWPEQR